MTGEFDLDRATQFVAETNTNGYAKGEWTTEPDGANVIAYPPEPTEDGWQMIDKFMAENPFPVIASTFTTAKELFRWFIEEQSTNLE